VVTGGGRTELVRRGSRVPGAPLVSVCVLVLTDPTLALDCLDSLAAASVDYAVETIVVANGTSEEALSVLEPRDDIVLVRSGTNLGFAGGNNLAADLARGRFLLLINDDSTVEEGFVNRLVATAEADPTIGAVGGRILAADGSLQEAGSVLLRDGWATHVGLGLGPDTRAFDYVRDTDYVSANGMLVRRSAWDAVGGLDERYFPAYYEDVDLCLALRRQGYRVVYEPRARVHHLESQSTSRRYRNFLLIRNRRRLVDKWATDLAGFDDRPSVIDEAAIERSIHRARGQPPRLLVVAEGAGGSGADLWEVAARLASEGWAVTVSSADPDSDPDRSTRADRMANLGVDVCGEAVAATTALVFDAVLVGTEFAGRPPRLVRPDGRDTPVVRASPEEGEVGVRATASAVAGNLA
jgi:GT2 family glycosyltransferase